MTADSIPDGFMRMLDAIDRLTRAMYSGVGRPDPVTAIKRQERRLPVRFGPWKDKAGQLLKAAAVSGALPVYVVGDGRARPEKQAASVAGVPIQLPKEVLLRLVTPRGYFTDRPIRPSLKIAGGDQSLFMALSEGWLVLRDSEFDAWFKRERAKGKWPSQGSRTRRRVGRPTKQSSHLRSAIEKFVAAGMWRGRDGISKLHRLLIDEGMLQVPSEDTLARFVDRLYSETGASALRRQARLRRKVR